MKHSAIVIALIWISASLGAQGYNQYFDGADTGYYSAPYFIDSGSVWQVGPPQKTIFDSAASQPNVLITDTVLHYPKNDTSRVVFKVPNYSFQIFIMAFQWMQKLDMDSARDFGMVEFKAHSDSSYVNAFNNPYVYNFYGFQRDNARPMANGDSAFTASDSSWRDIWFCLDYYYFMYSDTAYLRFTFVSDSIDEQREGWMIDNFIAHETLIHTVKEGESEAYMKVFPSPTTGRVDIQVEKQNEYHIIEKIELLTADGKLVQTYGRAPTKFWIDISDQPNGMYLLRITTNLKSETHQIMLQH
ncbi:MAG: T9SS type A sorting domain-containing protein [Vicingaceae bacterium]